ncbi:DUF1127 domain-containing protein [Paragemmobacter ruber]|uniref:DUF1127 domain-containing protein n=1 Tax=Paragemmobacter ruber TaxID=1985673 RepID=A0ABW9Y907_9RHOB|nr:DUF1127 domain-containing protein [Rhodobacter ruber]NBE08639.1 DUF1127 domain-containing protein [Rhodobacter ruber]
MSARPLPHVLSAPLPPLSRLLVSVALTLADWEARRRGRRALARLDEHLLRDIGLGEDHAAREAAKAFWQD